jgi:co-chaperonin GroES (HSP10)
MNTTKTIQPVNGHIVLKEVEESDQMAGNIFLPDMGKEKPVIAEVVAVSKTFNWHTNIPVPSEVEIGNVVLVPKMGSQRVSIDMNEYIVCKSTDIIGIVK